MTQESAPVFPHPDDVTDTNEFFARYGDLRRNPILARSSLDEAHCQQIQATLSGMTVEHHKKLQMRFDAAVAQSARHLCKDEEFVADLEALPFADGETVVALGDSVTDDACSWAQILQQVFAERRRDLNVVNAGVSGDTTSDALTRTDLLARSKPHWVIQLLGTNDARRHGRSAQVRAVSEQETSRNVLALEQIIVDDIGAKLIRMSPTPVVGKLADRWSFFNDLHITWRTHDIEQMAQMFAGLTGNRVDLHTAFLDGPDGLLLPDGVHPTVAGHEQIVRTLVASLAGTQ